jgi:uncharacterized protein (DUF2235 family)
MKRLVVCCDGTWNDLNISYPTNVVKLSQAIKPIASNGISQSVYYSQGLGTRNPLDRLPGGAFGWGIDKDIQDAYLFLCLNYSPGDEIYLFGFSRGAYTVRSLAGLIYCSGLLSRINIRHLRQAYALYRSDEIKPSSTEAITFRQQYGDRVPIALLGCWDTVGSLGVPDLLPGLPLNQWINRKYSFHDQELSAIIQRAIHAVAIDEPARVLNVTPMERSKNPTAKEQVLRQIWFPGLHGCVGGGTQSFRGLSDTALQWMLDEIRTLGLGLDFDPAHIWDGIHPDYTISFQRRLNLLDLVGGIQREVTGSFEDLHESTKRRWHELPNYRPEKLEKYHADLKAYSPKP